MISRSNRILAESMIITLFLGVLLNIVHFQNFQFIRKNAWWFDAYNLVNGIIINLLAAYVFYLLIVLFIENNKQRVKKNNFINQYQQFKKSMVNAFLGALGKSEKYEVEEGLLDIVNFRNYFDQMDENENHMWDSLANKIEDNKYTQREILSELVLLQNEISYLLSHIEINDERAFIFFKNLSQIIYKMQLSDFTYDDTKILMRFLWQLFAGWDISTGYRDEDVVESFFNKI